MAGYAGTSRDTKMFEGSSRPAHSPVATVAGHGRRNMSRGLACRGSLVMAFGTGSRRHTVVGKERGRPICRPMTAAAIDGGRYVIRRFERGHDSSAWRMALHTLGGSSPKNALKVAALTVDLRMAAAERETSAAVIDFNARPATSLGRGGARRQQEDGAYCKQCGDDGPGEPANDTSHHCVRHFTTTPPLFGRAEVVPRCITLSTLS